MTLRRTLKNLKAASWNRWFLVLGASDLILVLINLGFAAVVTAGISDAVPDTWKIGKEVSLASRIVFAKWAVAAVLFVLLARRPGARGFIAVAAVMIMLFLDDTLEGHEQLGVKIAGRLGISDMFGLRGGGVGEIIVMGGLALFALGAMLIGRRWIAGALVPVYWTTGVLIIILGFFATGVDALNAMARNTQVLAFWLGLIEDSGEMVVASAIVAVPAGMLFGRTGPAA